MHCLADFMSYFPEPNLCVNNIFQGLYEVVLISVVGSGYVLQKNKFSGSGLNIMIRNPSKIKPRAFSIY